jgi:hypothetical protein
MALNLHTDPRKNRDKTIWMESAWQPDSKRAAGQLYLNDQHYHIIKAVMEAYYSFSVLGKHCVSAI